MSDENLPEQSPLKVAKERTPDVSLAGPPGFAGESLSVVPEGSRKLDPKVIRLWRTTAWIRTGLFLLAAIIGGTLLLVYRGTSVLVLVPIWLGLALLVLLETRWLPVKRYESTSYRLGEGFFEFCSGIFWKTSVMIPLSRVQHVDLLSGPLEQRHGLATLVLHTAGTSKASQAVPGLKAGDAVRIREMILTTPDIESGQVPDSDSENLRQ